LGIEGVSKVLLIIKDLVFNKVYMKKTKVLLIFPPVTKIFLKALLESSECNNEGKEAKPRGRL
jgi:hypothetical protein